MIKDYIKRYMYYAVMLVITIVLFISVSYENLNNINLNIFKVNGKEIELKNELYINEKIYMSYEDIQSFLGDDVYIDKISRKIIVTSKISVRKYELNSKEKQVNFEYIDTQLPIYIKYNGKDYLLLEEIADMYNYDVILNDINGLELVLKDKITATLKSNREYGYLQKDKKNTRVVLDNSNVEVINNEQSKYYTIVEDINGVTSVIYVLKNDVNIQENIEKNEETLTTDFLTIFYNGNIEQTDNFTNAVILDGLKIRGKDGSIENNIQNVTDYKNKQIYISVTNGYASNNYDNSITTQMLQSDIAREKVITEISSTINNLKISGVVIDFRQLNSSCKQDFTQLVKELSAYLHNTDKKVLVYVPLNATYIDIYDITKYSDFVILIQYGAKEVNSKVSGTHSGINWIESNLQQLKQNDINMSKVIMEIPLYSIIWTEKNNKVIDAEKISMKALEEYIEKNKLSSNLDEVSRQNYIEFVKGTLKYKIWLEDTYSVKQKIKLAKNFGLAGVSLFKKGNETESLIQELGGI